MRSVRLLVLMFLITWCNASFGQSFILPRTEKYEEINFKPVGKLIYVPVVVNNVPLNFILDTGVNKTVILNLGETDSLELKDVEEIFITGLGKKEPFKAVYSRNNKAQIGSIVNKKLDIFIVTDGEVNFSRKLGVEVHGIIGYDLLKDFVIRVDYIRGKLRFYRFEDYEKKKKRRSEAELPLNFQRNKPYIDAYVKDTWEKKVRLLVDTGSTDALWLFKSDTISVPQKYFDDYLGIGLTGEIHGKRSKVDYFSVGGFELDEVKSAFPEAEYLVHIDKALDRDGSVGAELLSRFYVTFNYNDKWIRLKKNRDFRKPFYYNMSGITIQHNGVRLVEELRESKTSVFAGNKDVSEFFVKQLNYELAPIIEISELRENSPAALAGLQIGDVLLSVNGKAITDDNIEQIVELLNSKEGRKIKVFVERNNEKLKFQFELKKLL